MKKPNLYPPIKKIKDITEAYEKILHKPKKKFFWEIKEEKSDDDRFNRLETLIEIGNTQLLGAINSGNRQILLSIKELSNSISELSGAIQASNELNFQLLNVILERTSFMDKGFAEKVQSFSSTEKRLSDIEKRLSQSSNKKLGVVPLKSESSKGNGNEKNSSSSHTAKSHPNFINNEINSNDSHSRKMTIYKRKKFQKMLMKGASKKSSQLEAFQQLLDSNSLKKAKRPMTSVVPKSNQNEKKDEN